MHLRSLYIVVFVCCLVFQGACSSSQTSKESSTTTEQATDASVLPENTPKESLSEATDSEREAQPEEAAEPNLPDNPRKPIVPENTQVQEKEPPEQSKGLVGTWPSWDKVDCKKQCDHLATCISFPSKSAGKDKAACNKLCGSQNNIFKNKNMYRCLAAPNAKQCTEAKECERCPNKNDLKGIESRSLCHDISAFLFGCGKIKGKGQAVIDCQMTFSGAHLDGGCVPVSELRYWRHVLEKKDCSLIPKAYYVGN